MLLRLICFLLILICILVYSYFPEMARQYEHWIDQSYFTGTTRSKNMLGVLCLVGGLFIFWDTLTRWSEREAATTKQPSTR